MPKIDTLDALVDAMTTILTNNFDNQPKLCPRYASDISKICPRSVQDMPKECPRYARGMPEISPRYALDISPMNILTTDLE